MRNKCTSTTLSANTKGHIMNKKFFWIISILLSLTLSACASILQMIPGTAQSGASAEIELPTQTKLILGVINLDETENAVTAEQAKELLPMFHVLQDLNESDTAAQEEIDGLTNQIEETLTTDQVNAIDAMSLTRQDMFAIIQGNNGGTNTSAGASTTTGGGGGMGGPPEMGGGGMPDGGPGGGMSAGTTSASGDANVTPAMDTSTPSALFEAVIKLLEKKLQSL
jgi:hypothetical protein